MAELPHTSFLTTQTRDLIIGKSWKWMLKFRYFSYVYAMQQIYLSNFSAIRHSREIWASD